MEGNTDNGFTLIELSIVLVIIGLLVGGILIGRDLIRAAEIRAQISQIEKYQTAVNTFRTKYNGLPGDLNVGDAAAVGMTVGSGCAGQQGGRDGNGLLDGFPSPQIYAVPIGETDLFWIDLTTANLIDWSAANAITTANCGGIGDPVYQNHFPPAKIGMGNSVYVYEVNNSNWFGLSHVTAIVAAAMVGDGNIPVIDASNIDTKVDDGYPTTGHVVAVFLAGGNQTGTALPTNGSTPTTSTCYDTSSGRAAYSLINQGSGPNCALSFKFQ